jgi:transcriptional regulator with XRE-family HTH domain
MVTTSQASARARVFRRAAAQFPRVFGDRLRRLRLAAGFSQAECATRCGISLRSLSRYENNTTEPSAPVLLLLAAGIGVEPADLLGVAHEQGSEGR